MRALLGDLRFGVRVLARSPMFTLAAVLSLALGIGVNSTIFSLVSGVLLRPPPGVHDADRLVWMFETQAKERRSQMTFSQPDYLDARERREVFSGVAAYRSTPLHVGDDPVTGQLVSGDFFSVLRVPPALGRTLVDADDAPGAPPVAVIGHRLWQTRFDGDPAVIGRAVTVDKRAYTIVGVAAAGFVGPEVAPPGQIWLPLAALGTILPTAGGADPARQRNLHHLTVVARLARGVSVDQARAAMGVLAQQLARSYPDTNREIGIRVDPVRGGLNPGDRGDAVPIAVLLLAVVGLVLLIACVNVGSLMLARGATRRREMAIRRALGAGRWRLVRQLLTESVLLALAGGAVALLLAFWASDALAATLRDVQQVSMALDVSPDLRVLLFTLGVSLLAGLGFGLAPALHGSRADPAPALAAETVAASAGAHRSRLRNAFVVAQVALSFLLLTGSGLFLRSLSRASSVDPGFDPAHALTLPVDTNPLQLAEPEGRELYTRLVERVGAVPGVRVASLAEILPLGRSAMIWAVGLRGRPSPSQPAEETLANAVGPGYFAAMGIPILAGRELTLDDRAGARPVVVVSEALARRSYGGDALGKTVWLGQEPAEIVGVARDSKYRTLGEETQPFLYVPLLQHHATRVHLVVGLDPAAPASAAAVRQAVAASAPELGADEVDTMARIVDGALFPARMGAILLGAFGLLALALAVIGIYGVLAYAVGMRTREIGIRVALGAGPPAVRRLVVGEGMKLVAIGLAIGLALAFAATRLLGGFLYGVSPTDAVTLVSVLAILAGAAFVASWLPARRASRVDPVVALRRE